MVYKLDDKILEAREKEKNNVDQLINNLSAARKEQIQMFANNDPRIREAELKYGKYLFVPLALPMFELPDKDHFLSWWNSHHIVPNHKKEYAATSGYGVTPFETIDLINEIGDQWWEPNNQQESFIKEFPHLWQQVNDQLPCDKLLRFTLWSSRHAIQEHRDGAECVDIPVSYRIKMYDENPEESLYLFDNPLKPYEITEATMLPRAPGTNSFVWNNLRCKHGSVYNPEHKKVIAFAFGITNIKRYEELLDRSVNIYKDYCITSDYNTENYVNI